MLAKLLDQQPFNLAVANLYKTRFNGVPGVVYAAGVRHAYNLAEAFRAEGMKAQAVSGETPKRELAEILARYERGDIDVLINAQLLAEGWNCAARDRLRAPRADRVQAHLPAARRAASRAATRARRRGWSSTSCTPRPSTTTRSSRCTRCSTATSTGAARSSSARCGAGAAGAMRVERRVLPVCAEEERRFAGLRARAVADRGRAPRLRRAARVGGARRRARARPTAGAGRARCSTSTATGELQEPLPDHRGAAQHERRSCGCGRWPTSPRCATPTRSTPRSTSSAAWPREERNEATKIMLHALVEQAHRPPRPGQRVDLADRRVHARGARGVRRAALAGDQAPARPAGQLLGRRARAQRAPAVHAARKQDRRLAAALLAAALAHTPEAEEALRGARTRMARKPPALARELLRNFPKRRARGKRRRRRGGEAATARPRPSRRRAATPPRRSQWRRGAPPASRSAARRRSARRGTREAPAAERDARTASAREPDATPARRSTLEDSSRGATGAAQPGDGEVDLAGAERRVAAVRERTSSRPRRRCRESALAGTAPPALHASRAEQRVALAPRRRGSRRRALPSHASSATSSARASARPQPARAPSSPRGAPRQPSARASRSSGGSSSRRTATFRPIPSTAQPSCGRPSTRIPATLTGRLDVCGREPRRWAT